MQPVLLAVFVLLAASQISAQDPNDTLLLTIYYEALCPDSIKFIETQLIPGYELLGDTYLNLDFVPFGFANATYADGAWSFSCAHGPAECYGNIIQSCVLSLFPKEAGIAFVLCAMSSGNSSDDANISYCAEQAGIPVYDVNECYLSGLGDELLVLNGYRTDTLEPELYWMPTLVFSGVYDDALQQEAQFNFLPTVCGLLEDKPEACASG